MRKLINFAGGMFMEKFFTLALAALLAGYVGQTIVFAVKDASETHSDAGDQDKTLSWALPGQGSMYAGYGAIYVEGSGSLTQPGDNVYSGTVNSWADREYICSTTDCDSPMWFLDVACLYVLKAEVDYQATVPVAVETHHAHANCAVEVRGAFVAFEEVKVVVDNYSQAGWSYYDADGGGAPPTTYTNGGYLKVVASSAPGTGVSSSISYCGPTVGQWYTGSACVFNLYARSNQHIYNHEEEDAAHISTLIEANDPAQPGWRGTLVAYDDMGWYLHFVRAFNIP